MCATSGCSICLFVRNHLFIAIVYSAAYWYVYCRNLFHIGVCHSYCSFPLVIKLEVVFFFLYFFSSPEPKAPGELIGWEGSVVRRPSTISNDLSSETTGPIATKFHIQPPGPLGKKSCSNGLDHMTNMAAMPTYSKNHKKSSSPKPLDR